MNNFGFVINPLLPLWLIALIVPLFLFFIWKELKRKQRFLFWRIIAQVLVLCSLLGVLLRPGFIQEIKSSSMVLLTPGYNKEQVDSLLSINPSLRVLKLPDVDYDNAEVLRSYFDLRIIDKEIDYVLGEGIPQYGLDLMAERKFQFLPMKQISGVTKLILPNKPKANEQAIINGSIKTEGQTMLTLIGPGGREDSIALKGSSTSFSLKFIPKQAGLFVYELKLKNKTSVRTEQIPIEVFEQQKLNILFLQKAPGFELRQLKNFLAEKGHTLALRYQISKNNFRVEFANQPPKQISPLTFSLLKPFDLIIADADALASLSKSEKDVLEKSIHDGIGMIILQNKAIEKGKLNAFLPVEVKKIEKDTLKLSLPSKQYTLPVVPIQVEENPSLYTVKKSKDRILSLYHYSGAGKVGAQLLQETYRIALEGNINDYASIWMPLVERTARSKNETFKIGLSNSIPVFQNHPLSIEIISSTEEHPMLQADGIALPLTENVLIDNHWLGEIWADKPGWHQLSTSSSVLNYFVSSNDSWNSLRVANQLNANRLVSTPSSTNTPEHITQEQKTVPFFWFFVLFILASGYLWLAPKL